MLNTYKVFYRMNGQTDNAWVQATDTLEAKAQLIMRFPGAVPTKAVLLKEGDPIEDLRPLAAVIHVDFKARKRVA